MSAPPSLPRTSSLQMNTLLFKRADLSVCLSQLNKNNGLSLLYQEKSESCERKKNGKFFFSSVQVIRMVKRYLPLYAAKERGSSTGCIGEGTILHPEIKGQAHKLEMTNIFTHLLQWIHISQYNFFYYIQSKILSTNLLLCLLIQFYIPFSLLHC